jgi:hypothetical protein
MTTIEQLLADLDGILASSKVAVEHYDRIIAEHNALVAECETQKRLLTVLIENLERVAPQVREHIDQLSDGADFWKPDGWTPEENT